MAQLKQRMYSIVLRHLSGIQKGIQHGHSVDQFGVDYQDTIEYKQWVNIDKTVVILEVDSVETLEKAYTELITNNIPRSFFKEPDLGDIITAISFLADEMVWDTDVYPDKEPSRPSMMMSRKDEWTWKQKEIILLNTLEYGAKVAFLRQFKNRFRLASN